MLQSTARFAANTFYNSLSESAKKQLQVLRDGKNFDSMTPELKDLRSRAMKLTREFNNCDPFDAEKKSKILKELFDTDTNLMIEPPIDVEYGINTKIGHTTFLNKNTLILDTCGVEIGHHVLFAPGCSILTATHDIDPGTRWSHDGVFGKPVKIGNCVWLGANVTVLPGVTIGDNVTIGAGSVVTKDIPPNCVAAGVPAKVIKYFTPSEKTEKLYKE